MTMPIDPNSIHLFHEPKDQLRMTVSDAYSVVTVEPRWAAPLSHPDRYLGILNGKGEELLMLEDLEAVSESNRKVLEEELRRRYLTSTIHRILSAKVEFGATYWTVITERGERDFVAQSLQENAQWLSERQLLIVDIDGNRFEIPDIDQLDEKSRSFVDSII